MTVILPDTLSAAALPPARIIAARTVRNTAHKNPKTPRVIARIIIGISGFTKEARSFIVRRFFLFLSFLVSEIAEDVFFSALISIFSVSFKTSSLLTGPESDFCLALVFSLVAFSVLSGPVSILPASEIGTCAAAALPDVAAAL